MKKICYGIALASMMALAGLQPAQAQERSSEYNENSVHPIRESDIMLRKRIWRRIDLNEKQNKPFFSFNNEISKILIEAVKAGVLTPYVNDSLTRRMPREEFLENLRLPDTGGGLTEEEIAMGFGQEEQEDSGWDTGGGWGDESASGAKEGGGQEAAAADEFLPREINVLEIMEDMIFDKKRSRLYWDIQAVTMIIPGSNPALGTGLQRAVASFRYKDLVELFKSMPGEAIWFNPQNSAAHLNLSDAFALRLFNGRIIKVANPNDDMIVDVYGKSPKEGLMASQWIEMELLEQEHELWEF
jgi:gliding motility associated protien GldN